MAAEWVMTDEPCEFDRLSGGTLLIAPDIEGWFSLNKDIERVRVLIRDKLSAMVVGKRVAWRRPGAMSPASFNCAKTTVESLKSIIDGSPQLLDLCIRRMNDFAEKSDNIEHIDTVDGLVGGFNSKSYFFDKKFHILMEYEDTISTFIMAQAEFLEECNKDSWDYWKHAITRNQGMNNPDGVRRETAAGVWDSIVQELLGKLYSYVVCERYYLDDNLIYTDNLSRWEQRLISNERESLDFRVMLNRRMQKLIKDKVPFYDFNHFAGEVYTDKREIFINWRSQSRDNHEIHRNVIFSEDPNVLFDFKMRFG